MVSYSTSPAFEVPKGSDQSNTTALLQTCFRQVEYAGVIAGAQNQVGGQKFIDFMLSKKVQADIPGEMYMYPADTLCCVAEGGGARTLSSRPFTVASDVIAASRDTWIRDWTAKVIG